MIARKWFLCFLIVMGVSSSTFAYNIFGPYIGVQGPVAFIREGSGLKDLANTITNLRLVGPPGIQYTYRSEAVYRKISYSNTGVRGFIGWSFNPFISIEGGYGYYFPNKYRAQYAGESIDTQSNVRVANIYLNSKTQTQVFDLMGKLTLPLVFLNPQLKNWAVYGKGGMAYVITKIKLNLNSVVSLTTVANAFPPMANTRTNDTVTPTYGAGITYNFNPNFTVDFSWTGFAGRHRVKLIYVNNSYVLTNLSKVIPSGNLFAFGIIYKFTNLF